MAGFKFRLQSLLKLRQAVEDQAKRQLARMMAQEKEARARLAEYRQAHLDTVAGRRQEPNQIIDIERLRATERYLVALERRIMEASGLLAKALEQVAMARAALVKAHRDYLMLVRLRERRLDQFNLEAQRAEAREVDEMAVLRHRFNQANPNAEAAP